MPGVPVARGPSARAIAMHHTLEALALGSSRDLDELSQGEDLHGHFGARCGRVADEVEAPHHVRRRLEPRLLGVTELGLLDPALAPGAEAELHRLIPHLDHAARTRLDDRHRYGGTVLGEDAGHAELPADQYVGHALTPP